MPDEEENGRIVEFPEDEIRMPSPRLPRPVGRIEKGHPLLRPLIVLIVALCIFLLIHFVVSVFTWKQSGPDNNDTRMFSETYREPGAITYQDRIVEGWFLDPERQHFMTEDGRRFTYVDSHAREGMPVSGHWRLME